MMLRNNKIFILIFLAVILQTVSATTVELTADKDVVWIGQKIELTLKLHTEDRITGQLTIINLDEKRQEKILFQSSRPGCTCKADTRVIGDFTDKSTFTPVKLGNYQARAYFDQIEKTVNFTVKSRLQEETTTIPDIPSKIEDYLKLKVYNLDKCQNTVLGGINTLNVDIGGEINGIWAGEPNTYVLYSCDGGEIHPVDKILLKGGSTFGVNQTVAGSYRLMVRCGRNKIVEDLTKCKTVEVYLDTKGIIKPEITKEKISTTTSTSTPATTTTTLEETTSTTIKKESTSIDYTEPEEEQNISIFDGCPCDWAPMLIGVIFIFVVLVNEVYKYLGGGKKPKQTGLGGFKK